MRFLPIAVLGVFLLVIPAGGQSPCGTIDRTGATIEASAAASTVGTVTIDACRVGGTPPAIPAPGTIGTIGTMTGSLPTFPGGGTGSGGAFHATTDVLLLADTYNYTSFEVDNLVTVTCSKGVTINVTGSVRIDGQLLCSAASGSINIRCGGDFSMTGSAGKAVVEATGTDGHVDIFSNGTVSIQSRNHVNSALGNVRIVGLGIAGTGPSMLLDATIIETDGGDLTIISRSTIQIGGASIQTNDGTLLIQCFEDRITHDRSGSISGRSGPEVALEAKLGVHVTGGAYVENNQSPIRIEAYDGDVRLDDYCTISSYRAIEIGASGDVILIDNPYIETYKAPLTLRSYGGDVRIEVEPPGPWGGARIGSDGGDIDIRAAGSVKIGGDTRIRAGNGDMHIRALGGDVVVEQSARIGDDAERHCDIDIRASNRIDATISPQSSGGGHIRGGTVRLSSGSGGIHLAQEKMMVHQAGGVTMISEGKIEIGNWVDAFGDILVSSRTEVDLSENRVSTWSVDAMSSGSITIESWGGSAGKIDAGNATVDSGAGDPASGDVSLLVRTPDGAAPPPDPVESFFLPKRIVVKVNQKKLEKSKLIAVGFFDMGPDHRDLRKPATLTIGSEVIAVPGLVPNSSGAKYVHKATGLTFQITPSRRGSSRAKFKLKRTGDLTGTVDPEADLWLRFEFDGVDGKGACALTKGKYALKRVRGTLIAPNLYLSRVKAVVKGDGKDKLKLVLGLATDGATPAKASDVRIWFGESFDVTIPAASFVREGDRYLFKGDVKGITQVSVDYRKEAVTIKGKGMDLGDFPQGPSAVFVGLSVAGDSSAVRVRLVRTRSALRY